jgi:AP-3 complex subunit delta-1
LNSEADHFLSQFAVLTPEEPRLVKKLVPPLTDLIETTPAMSLLYECIQTSIVGGMLNGREGEILATTCVEKLGSFLEDVDQNRKSWHFRLCQTVDSPRGGPSVRYIALVALVKIAPTHPHLISTHHDTILNCVDDPDMSIRMRALDLVETMVSRRYLTSLRSLSADFRVPLVR